VNILEFSDLVNNISDTYLTTFFHCKLKEVITSYYQLPKDDERRAYQILATPLLKLIFFIRIELQLK